MAGEALLALGQGMRGLATDMDRREAQEVTNRIKLAQLKRVQDDRRALEVRANTLVEGWMHKLNNAQTSGDIASGFSAYRAANQIDKFFNFVDPGKSPQHNAELRSIASLSPHYKNLMAAKSRVQMLHGAKSPIGVFVDDQGQTTYMKVNSDNSKDATETLSFSQMDSRIRRGDKNLFLYASSLLDPVDQQEYASNVGLGIAKSSSGNDVVMTQSELLFAAKAPMKGISSVAAIDAIDRQNKQQDAVADYIRIKNLGADPAAYDKARYVLGLDMEPSSFLHSGSTHSTGRKAKASENVTANYSGAEVGVLSKAARIGRELQAFGPDAVSDEDKEYRKKALERHSAMIETKNALVELYAKAEKEVRPVSEVEELTVMYNHNKQDGESFGQYIIRETKDKELANVLAPQYEKIKAEGKVKFFQNAMKGREEAYRINAIATGLHAKKALNVALEKQKKSGNSPESIELTQDAMVFNTLLEEVNKISSLSEEVDRQAWTGLDALLRKAHDKRVGVKEEIPTTDRRISPAGAAGLTIGGTLATEGLILAGAKGGGAMLAAAKTALTSGAGFLYTLGWGGAGALAKAGATGAGLYAGIPLGVAASILAFTPESGTASNEEIMLRQAGERLNNMIDSLVVSHGVKSVGDLPDDVKAMIGTALLKGSGEPINTPDRKTMVDTAYKTIGLPFSGDGRKIEADLALAQEQSEKASQDVFSQMSESEDVNLIMNRARNAVPLLLGGDRSGNPGRLDDGMATDDIIGLIRSGQLGRRANQRLARERLGLNIDVDASTGSTPAQASGTIPEITE